MAKQALGRGLKALIPDTPKARSGLAEIPIDRLRPNPEQPRTSFDPDALAALADSIRRHGVLQPLLVGDDGSGGSTVDLPVPGQRSVGPVGSDGRDPAGTDDVDSVIVSYDGRRVGVLVHFGKSGEAHQPLTLLGEKPQRLAVLCADDQVHATGLVQAHGQRLEFAGQVPPDV